MTHTNWQLLWDRLPADLRDKLKANPGARISDDDTKLLRGTFVALWREMDDNDPVEEVYVETQPQGKYLIRTFREWIEALPSA